MVRTVFFDFYCTFSISPNQEQPQGDAGCSAYWGGSCSRLLMFLQVYGRQVFDALPVRPVPGFVLLSAGGGTMVQAIPKAWTNCVQCCIYPLQPHWHLLSCASYLWPFILCNILGCRSSFSLTLRFVNGHRNTLVFKRGIHNVSGKYQFSAKYHPNLDLCLFLY